MTRRRRIVRAVGASALSLFALLLWSKLKLVSGIPRTALAVPGGDRDGARARPASDGTGAAAGRHAGLGADDAPPR